MFLMSRLSGVLLILRYDRCRRSGVLVKAFLAVGLGASGEEVCGRLVGLPVFKTGGAEHLGAAGSIPVHLRRLVTAR